MNTNGYPFNLFGFVVLVVFGGGFIVVMWPILRFFGRLTGTGWVGGIVLGAAIVTAAFVSVAREYSEHRESLPEPPRRR